MKSPLDEAGIAEVFWDNFRSHGELGASVCVWKEGREILSLAGGHRDRAKTEEWTSETPVLVWSVTKGLAAVSLLHVCQEKGVSPLTPVRAFWPEFGQAGKERVTIAEVLSHQAGLAALSHAVDAWDHQAVVTALAAEVPNWRLGEGHGYHPRTMGYLVDEMIRRLTGGVNLKEYWFEQFAKPLGIDVWIGLPESELGRVASIFPAKTFPPKDDPFFLAVSQSGRLTARAFGSPQGLFSVAAMNAPEVRMASFGAFGGVGTARGLGKFYGMLAAGGTMEGRRFFREESLEWMTGTRSQGGDGVLQAETAFAMGLMRDPVDRLGVKLREHFGPSAKAFGHPGAGGSHAFADPETGISFAYVMNQMSPGIFPGDKCLRLVKAIYK